MVSTRGIRRWSGPALAALVLAAAFASPQLRRVPAQMVAACTGWIVVALALESLSIGGFIVVFKLVFGGGMSWRRSVLAAFRGLGASGLLPAGGLIGPAAAASSVNEEQRHEQMARSAIAFVILTNFPGVIVAVALGAALALGLGGTQHDIPRTLAPAGSALALAVVTLALARSTSRSTRSTARSVLRRPPSAPRPSRWVGRGLSIVRSGAADACSLLRSADWKLLGAFGYYAFDNALLWAAFRAGGYAPAFSVIAMGYLVGSLGAALPLPGGIGATEGGLIGALVLYGAPTGPAAAAVLLYRGLTLLLPTLLGAAAWGAPPGARGRRATIGIDYHEQGATACSHTSSQSARRLLPR